MSAIETLKHSVETKSLCRYKRQSIDTFSASAILAIYDALSDTSKIKYAEIAERSLPKAAEMAFKLMNK